MEEKKINWEETKIYLEQYLELSSEVEDADLDWLQELLLSLTHKNEIYKQYVKNMEHFTSVMINAINEEEFEVCELVSNCIQIENKELEKCLKSFYNYSIKDEDKIREINCNFQSLINKKTKI